MPSIDLPTEYSNEFGALFEGFLLIPEDGIYEFALVSDDGSQLQIGGRVVVDNDGLHGATQRSGAAALAAGPHQFALLYFEAGGGKELRLLVRRPGGEAKTPEAWGDVPKSWYARSP
jgi:hypothetical protein